MISLLTTSSGSADLLELAHSSQGEASSVGAATVFTENFRPPEAPPISRWRCEYAPMLEEHNYVTL